MQERVGKVEERLKSGGEAIKRIETGLHDLGDEMRVWLGKIDDAIVKLALAQHDQARDLKHHMENEEAEVTDIKTRLQGLSSSVASFASHVSGCPRTAKIGGSTIGEYIERAKPYIVWALVGALGMTLISKEAVEKLGVFLKAFTG